jgi:phospholipid/cholesterol/gamma-HCH transport system substrate-binding protein
MEPQARYRVVGAAVLALLVLIAVVTAWLLASGNARELRTYTLYFEHESLEGLEPNSEVRMKGIRVGSVTRFAFAARRPGAVEVVVDVDAGAPVRQSTRGVVDRNLITGIASIRLVTLAEDSPLLRSAPPNEPYAVIAEGESQMQQITQTMSQLAQRADDTMRRIGATLSPENQAALSQTLENLRVATREAGALATRSQATMASIGRAADTLRGSVALAGDDFHRLADRYDVLGTRVGDELHEAATDVHRLGADASRLANGTEDLVSDADIELRLTSQQIRTAADAVSMTSKKLDDPRAALFGPAAASLGPGETKR